jgi:hypothetical protein
MPLWQLTFWCVMFSHDEPVWTFGERGIGWTCPNCRRFRVSPVYKELAS